MFLAGLFLIFLMDAASNHPLLPSHERALWKNLAVDEVTQVSFFFFVFAYVFFILLVIVVLFVFVYLFFNGFYSFCVWKFGRIHLNLGGMLENPDTPELHVLC